MNGPLILQDLQKQKPDVGQNPLLTGRGRTAATLPKALCRTVGCESLNLSTYELKLGSSELSNVCVSASLLHSGTRAWTPLPLPTMSASSLPRSTMPSVEITSCGGPGCSVILRKAMKCGRCKARSYCVSSLDLLSLRTLCLTD